MIRTALALAASFTLALSCGVAADTAPTGSREVRMRGNSFTPRDLRVTLGDTVVWVNSDIVRHNAVRDGVFDSGELRGGERYTWVPTDTGEVGYRCTIHQRMRGTVRVSAPAK